MQESKSTYVMSRLRLGHPPASFTLCTLLQNSRSVIVHGRWWWPWNAAIWLPTIGVAPLP